MDKAGALWVGTGRGLARFHAGEFKTWSKRDGLSNDMITALTVDNENAIWAGGAGGLDRIRAGVIQRFAVGNGDIRERRTDRSGRVMVTVNSGGVHVLEHGRSRFNSAARL